MRCEPNRATIAPMDPRVIAEFSRSGGLITRARALDLGVSPNSIAAHVRRGDWVPLHRGVFADTEVWRDLDPWHGRPLLTAKAAVLAMRRAWVLSHDSAVHAHELAWLRPEDEHTHITRPGHTNAWTKGQVKHHLARYRPDQAVRVGSCPALDIARTVADVSREHGLRHGLIVADSALHRGIPRSALEDAAAAMTSWPHVRTVRSVLDLADGGAQNAAESLARELILELGIGAPETQFPLWLGNGREAWGDIRVGCHIFEVHGLVKYLPVELGGLAQTKPAKVAFDERKRERLISAEGLGVSSLYYEDFFGSRRATAKKRLLADYNETVSRYGVDLPEHLARNAGEIRDRRRPPGAA